MPNELATIPDDPAKIDLIKRMVAKDCTNDELELFLYTCRRTGLDPLARQIYAVKRSGKMTIQTAIDGYRLIADRTGRLAGISDYLFDSEESKNPGKATVTVKKLLSDGTVADFTATARWGEYQAGGPMWAKMPFLMLGKCAEALALRKAFPADLSGVYTSEEMAQADSAAQGEAVYAEVARQKAQYKAPEVQQALEGAIARSETIPPELEWSYAPNTGILICRPIDVKQLTSKGANAQNYIAVKLNRKAEGKDMAFSWHASHAPALLSSLGKVVKMVVEMSKDGKFLNIEDVLEVDSQKVEPPVESDETKARLLASVLDWNEENLVELLKHCKGDWTAALGMLQQRKADLDTEVTA